MCVTDVTTPVARKRGGHRSVFLATPTLGQISQVCDFRLTSGKKQCGLETLGNALPERRKSANHSFKQLSKAEPSGLIQRLSQTEPYGLLNRLS